MISVVIPTYNRSDFVKKSVLSVIRQKYQDWELIVVDDGSNDGTENVLGDIIKNNSKIRYFYQENKGQGSARNFGLSKSSGDFILFLDSDDFLLPSSLEIIDRLIRKHPNGDVFVFNKWIFDWRKKKIVGVNGPNPSSVVFRKNVFDKFSKFSERKELIGLEDVEIWLKWPIIEREKRIRLNIKEFGIPIAFYSRHAGQITKNQNQSLRNKIYFMISQYLNEELTDKKLLSLKIAQVAHLDAVLGDRRSALTGFGKSIGARFNFTALILKLLLFFGGGVIYSLIIPQIKCLKDVLSEKLQLMKGIVFYSDLYSEAKELLLENERL